LGMVWVSARMPCLRAFFEEAAFPEGEMGPRLRRPLFLLISAR